jgi:hypothetical protein
LRAAEVGRIASCASWAFFERVRYTFTEAESACAPQVARMVSRMSATASFESDTESVRM